ncbi:MAG: polysaccharide deacetylase family protein [Bacteroidales bacterium]|nr:polysaccharide deacetylase family protein [Bacteroidales bacterium]
MKILTFDIEEWFLNQEYFGNDPNLVKQYDSYLNQLLDKLDEREQNATFFCVGGMAREFPDVVKLIASRGHEVGCHSDKHAWLNTFTRDELMEDTRQAVDSLEQLLGTKVISYRAPAFTVGDKNKYALEVLAACGIQYDASIFPAVHSLGGFADFKCKTPCIIRFGGIDIKEFPICTTQLLGHEVAYSGGGYFRFFPLWFVKKEMHNSDYSMTYFHIGDLVKSEPISKDMFAEYYKMDPTLKNRAVRYLKSNIGKSGSFNKLMGLLDKFRFSNVKTVATQIDWSTMPIIDLK